MTGSGTPSGSEWPILKRITLAAGLITAAIGALGLIGIASGVTVFTSVLPGYKPIAVSAALIWIFLGLVLVLHATRAHTGKLVLAVQVVLAGTAIIEATELVFSLTGTHTFIELLSVRVGSALLGNPTTPISPAASALIIPATIALFLLFSPGVSTKRYQQKRDAGGITGLAIALSAFTFVLSYVYVAPFLYNTVLIPMALNSALAGLFTGAGIVAAAGRTAIPLKYFTGSSTRARLLRVFVPLVIILTVVQDIIFIIIADVFQAQEALILSACIVLFSFVTSLVIARYSGRIGRDLERAEDALRQKNEDLGAMNEELTTISEELRQNNDELLRKEKALRESQQRNMFLADILDKSAQPFGVGYPGGKMGIVNKAFEDLTGYSAEELRGVDWVGVLTPPEWQEVERHHLSELHRTGKPVWYEKEYVRKDGTRVPIELLVHLVANEDGSPQYYYSFITDITKRKRAEEALRESEEKYRSIVETANEGIIIVDAESSIVYVNTKFADLLGYPQDELIGTSSIDLFDTEYVAPALKEREQRRQGGIWASYESKFIRKNGTPVWVLVNSSPVLDKEGRFAGSLGMVTDITTRRKVEDYLFETSQYLENLIDYANAPIIVWDPAFHITRFNHAFERLTGRKSSDVIGQRLELLFPEKYAGTAMDIIRRTTSGERLDVVEIPILHVSGMVRTVLWNSATLFENNGETVLSTIAQGNDITGRKKAEEELLRRNEDLNAANEEIMATQEELQQSNNELLESEQELRKTSQYLENLINYANAPIVVWDPNFVITRFNHAFEELTGRTAREIIGQRLEVLFPQHYLDASMEVIRKTMEGKRLKVVEIPILNRRGEIRIVLWNSATLYKPDGTTILSTIAQGNDITERKMTEAELEERNEELNSAIEELTRRSQDLNEALREKEVLLSEVHHRVKNNLTAFISLLSLESSYDDSPTGLALKKDLQNRARSMALIHETLYRTKKYSRVDMGEYLSTLVEQIVNSYETVRPIMTVVGTEGITLDLSRATPCGLIVNELLTNSLKYGFPELFDCESIRGAPCMIGVDLAEDDGAYVLTVRDNGIGLPRDLDIATTKTLGLKLVNFLAKHQLRASIEVHSNNGSVFRFRFRDKV